MSLFPATIPVTVEVYTEGQPDRLGVSTPTYSTLPGLLAYWLLTTATDTDPTVGAYTETAELGVPATFPAVKPEDRITVADRMWQVDGTPVDYALNPFADQWMAVTGELPGTVIHLRRAVNHTVEGGS